jgi:hypothetical protein
MREITSYWFDVLREITSYWFDLQKGANFKQFSLGLKALGEITLVRLTIALGVVGLTILDIHLFRGP